ncbi:hypothetical protein EDB97_105219 [Agrobacterium tumefaciens]|nr:hypothetical protein EDB97_105219 [Agrobacterium tumefaciens]
MRSFKELERPWGVRKDAWRSNYQPIQRFADKRSTHCLDITKCYDFTLNNLQSKIS